MILDDVRPETVGPANRDKWAEHDEFRRATGHSVGVSVALGIGHRRPVDQRLAVRRKVFAVQRQTLPFPIVAAGLRTELVTAGNALGCTADSGVGIAVHTAWRV